MPHARASLLLPIHYLLDRTHSFLSHSFHPRLRGRRRWCDSTRSCARSASFPRAFRSSPLASPPPCRSAFTLMCSQRRNGCSEKTSSFRSRLRKSLARTHIVHVCECFSVCLWVRKYRMHLFNATPKMGNVRTRHRTQHSLVSEPSRVFKTRF